jgi:tubulin-specific chaperone A
VVIAALAAYTAALKVHELWLNRVAIGTKALHAVNVIFKGGLYALQIIFYTLTGQMAKARGAMLVFAVTTKAVTGPFALIASLIVAAITALVLFTGRTSEYIDKAKALAGITKEVNRSIYREKTELELLFSVAKNETVSKEERLKAIKKLNDIAPEYLGNINLENINTQAVVTAVKAYTDELIKNAKAKAVADKITELEGKRPDKIAKLEEKNNKRSSDANIGSLVAEIKNDIKLKLLKNENEEIGRQQKLYAELNIELF